MATEYRMQHGMITNPVMRLVAKKSKSSLAEVIAVWAYFLEIASSAKNRGSVEAIDFESVDCLFDFEPEQNKAKSIYDAFCDRGMIAGGRISTWEEDQPKREREDSGAAERQARKRAKDAQQNSQIEPEFPVFEIPENQNVTPCHAMSRHVTPCHAEEKYVTPFHENYQKNAENVRILSLEEDIYKNKLNTTTKEKEKKIKKEKESEEKKFDPSAWLAERKVFPQHIKDWLQVRKQKRAVMPTLTVLTTIERQAEIAGISVADAIQICASRGWIGFDASWLEPKKQNGQGPPNGYHRKEKFDATQFINLGRKAEINDIN